VVYGIDTDETILHPDLLTSFHYDEIFGTALNRFCVQAVAGHPLTVYGKGYQKRGFLNIIDTLKCVELAVLNPPEKGKMRVLNQFTEIFSIMELAELVQRCAREVGLKIDIHNFPNPRIEKEEHYYNPVHTKLLDLGLKPKYLEHTLINSMLVKILQNKHRIDSSVIRQNVVWNKHTMNVLSIAEGREKRSREGSV
jgi:UDP-sulfoquinovose synthase